MKQLVTKRKDSVEEYATDDGEEHKLIIFPTNAEDDEEEEERSSTILWPFSLSFSFNCF